ncbi:H-type small acid-soluble spore protein [Virgibacillus doumboii]|uniref:H-type small acid-soluble spore protein n=1 Tax=Virgibacillus doumboii TaxID=2697503 RepID=UPI0013DF1A58|nr:H-type small acid-soluble spore protein [Virgibacillus doumboii]
MESKRVQEIMDSITMINVKYHGIPVYIQEVNTDSEMATIFPLDEMHNEQQVDLQGLFEDGP